MARGKSHYVCKAFAGIAHRRQAIPIETLGPRFGMTLTVVYKSGMYKCILYSLVAAYMHVTCSFSIRMNIGIIIIISSITIIMKGSPHASRSPGI
jgi:uncharacterized protein YodC (DUF2158 family)